MAASDRVFLSGSPVIDDNTVGDHIYAQVYACYQVSPSGTPTTGNYLYTEFNVTSPANVRLAIPVFDVFTGLSGTYHYGICIRNWGSTAFCAYYKKTVALRFN